MAPRLPTKGEYPLDWPTIATQVKAEVEWKCARCDHPHDPPNGRTLTVHHFDGDKANCLRWNLMPLCQACHLSVQARVNPETPYLFTPAVWSLPYIAGFYEAGRGLAPEGYSLAAYRSEYEASGKRWPSWAPGPGQ